MLPRVPTQAHADALRLAVTRREREQRDKKRAALAEARATHIMRAENRARSIDSADHGQVAVRASGMRSGADVGSPEVLGTGEPASPITWLVFGMRPPPTDL